MDPNRLKAIPIFSHLSDQEAKRLAAFATETSVADGQILMKQGDYSTELIGIQEGTADVIRGKRIPGALARQLTPQATGADCKASPTEGCPCSFSGAFVDGDSATRARGGPGSATGPSVREGWVGSGD